MGRYVKNTEIRTGSNAIRVPFSTSANGPSSPVDSQVRYNTGSHRLEVFANGAWTTVATIGRVSIEKDEYLGNGIKSTFTLSVSYGAGEETHVLVFVGNVFQNPGVAYSIDGDQITFSSPPDNTMPVVVLHNFNSTNTQA